MSLFPPSAESCEINLSLNDRLAVERTRMANERTLLAYVRTALAVAAAGATLLGFFSTHPALFWVGWLMMIGGGVLLIVGIYRFLLMRSKLCDVDK